MPPIAHFVVLHDTDPSQLSEREWMIRSEVVMGLVLGTFVAAIPILVDFDPIHSWRTVAEQLAMLYLVQLVSGAVLIYLVLDDISFEHIKSLLKESPFVMVRYIYHLPWDGWGQLSRFIELLWEMYWRSRGRTLLEGGEPTPTIALRHSGGRNLAKVTASI